MEIIFNISSKKKTLDYSIKNTPKMAIEEYDKKAVAGSGQHDNMDEDVIRRCWTKWAKENEREEGSGGLE